MLPDASNFLKTFMAAQQVEADHKPLENILDKPLASALPKLQRMILEVQKVQLESEIQAPEREIPVVSLSLARLCKRIRPKQGGRRAETWRSPPCQSTDRA